jgi:hypothetical protein
VDDEADVRLVHAHPEGDGRHDHADLVGHEPLLHLVAPRGAKTCVVGRRVDSRGAQLGGEIVALLAGGRVDDSGRR